MIAFAVEDLTFRQKRAIVVEMKQNILKSKILKIVGDYFDSDLKCMSRKRVVVFPKMVAAHCLWVFTDLPLHKISKELGHTHGAAFHILKRLKGLCETDENIRKQVIHVESLIEQSW